MNRKSDRMADIARRLGVSKSTVSRSLSDSPEIGKATKARVLAEARAVGYAVNPLASALKTRRGRILLVLVPRIENFLFPMLLRTIERAASEMEYTLMIGYVAGDSRTDDRLLDFMYSGAADGVIIATGFAPDTLAERLDRGEMWPAAFVMTPGARNDIPSIALDDYGAGREVYRRLRAEGYKRIGMVSGASGPTAVGQLRRNAFIEAAVEDGAAREDLVIFDGSFRYETGWNAREFIAKASDRLDAVICGSDEIAFGLINGLRSLGVSVPRDLAVAGFDDILFARHFSPSLTTVRQPIEEMGRLAVAKIVEMVERKSWSATEMLGFEVVMRESAPAGGGEATPPERSHKISAPRR
ncbi:LacI family DNA-binding transcriptional regulator [Oceaniglobus trochenteri]|uniref:LacI family DNA-binding transcriptional regulator n=1 Tax=Oceaniglobus trochenteri TaxID=2763260 RepID=UPI001CFF6D09|nr:LacI family DNA-binding transcriptional regulator [Oceaniglobus trochenteri]